MNVRIIAAIGCLLSFSLNTMAQDSAPAASVVADPLTGIWEGTWDCAPGRCRSYGPMQMQLDVQEHRVTGRVRSMNARATTQDCSPEWEKLVGEKKGDKVYASYDLGGPCKKVDVVFSLDSAARVMTGTWSSQWPSDGRFELTKVASPKASAPVAKPE